MTTLKQFRTPALLAIVYLILMVWIPGTGQRVVATTISYAKEMALIMPAVFILIGLIEVWIPGDKIQKWLGASSGIKGVFISFLMGTLPTGPLYLAFPLAASLLKKGASITNIVIFLGSWAALKIPQLLVEIKFLGGAFTIVRFVLTLIVIIIMGIIMNILLKKDLEAI